MRDSEFLAAAVPGLEIGIPPALLSFFLMSLVLPVGVIASSRLFFRTRSETEG
ncbi:MAG TPA: hypothetical protein PLU72_14140 [Candidatus Ozemobacteraceae bacterium]|nr:hypothetical protein [Candidatus Ozemobacteraceae bacterium]HQG27405.1 hypothetical protein [Candidatus Ozemobacteraceae bacterium]